MIDSNGMFVDDPVDPVVPVVSQLVTEVAENVPEDLDNTIPGVAESEEVTTTEETIIDEVTASDGLSTIIQQLLGEYVPKTQTVTVIGSDGSMVINTEYVPGLAGLDYYWITGAILFGLCLHGVLALIGVICKHG